MKTRLFIFLSVFIMAFYACNSQDQQISKAVDTAISARYPEVRSSVKDGIVTLKGKVESQQVKSAVEQLAKNVKNVKSVSNELEVTAPSVELSQNNDAVLRTAITNNLTNKGYKDVKVEVKNGEVTLSGDIKRADLQAVMQVANEAQPTKVTNNLTLK